MKFKKLEVAGFKSFADKLEIKFGGGITGIVGPNGCGKSNVADSIRWVLGEQSAKLLRGSSMQDVIFNGTEHRKSLSFCEVNLHFNNTNKELFPSLDFNEVVISRKLYRSGESEYLLNKTVVRLKDIVDLLRDANMGKEGYSIIGQGRIDELLSSKPEDRRAIFEEAAGIAKHKSKKKESERRLERVQNELNLAQVIVDEKAKQLEPLTKQAENARKWLDLRDRLKTYEINTYIYQQDTASEAKAVINARLSGVTEEIDLRQKECDSVSMAYNDAMRDMNEADETLRRLREELLEISVGREKLTGEIKLLNERLGYVSLQSEKMREENEKLDAEYKMLLGLIEQGNAALSINKTDYESKKKSEELLSADYMRVTEELAQGEGEVETRHREVVEAMDKLTDIRSNMSRLLAEREALSVKISGLSERIKFNTDKLNIDEKEEAELKSEIERLSSQKTAYIAERDAAITVNNESLYLVGDAAAKLDKLNANYYSLKTRHKLIVEIKESRESFSSSVKRLLADAKTDENLSKRMEGFLAQLIKVKDGFETAIEMTLGNAVQNIVTKNEDDAKYLINYLKRRNYGRVTFLPITSVKPRNIDPKYFDLLKFDGCFGAANSLITYDKKYEPIISSLLGGTVVVDNMDNAVDLAQRSNYSFRIVTLDGDIIDPRGSITGGSKKSELSNIFGHDREIEELNSQLVKAESEISNLTALRTENSRKSEDALGTIRALRDKIHALDVDTAAKSETYKKLREDNGELAKTIGNLEFEQLEGSERAAAIDKDLNSVTELENIVKSEKDFAAAGGQERVMQFDSLRAERNRLHEQVMSAKMTLSALDNTIQNNESEIRRLQENVFSTAEKIESNNTQLAEYKLSSEKLSADMNALILSDNTDESDKAVYIRAKLDNLDEFKREKQRSVIESDEKRMALIAVIRELHEKKSREEMLLLKVDSDIEVLQQRIFEEYGMEYEDCLKFKEENYDHTAGAAESAKIRRQMSNLGNVNVDAIEQCREVFSEYETLNIKREDLIKSKSDLEQIIAKFNAEMLEKFTESFAAIRANFQRIFKELFDGGTADLVIQEGENILEAGIEIIAQPPEKKLQSISLLSGGERALTAIAILFAILRLKPMPFCVLDEIEAALDDANAGRFAKYLRRFSEDTQFIVITHRKPTMELADSLYGVTMEEKGVSKIVSVKLAEAVAAAEQISH